MVVSAGYPTVDKLQFRSVPFNAARGQAKRVISAQAGTLSIVSEHEVTILKSIFLRWGVNDVEPSKDKPRSSTVRKLFP